MTKPAVTLTLGTGLLVARVQDTFGRGGEGSGLYYAPGSAFSTSVDLLTRYDPLLADKIGPEFYAPSFLKPRVEKRITTPVAKMRMLDDARLPHRNPTVLKYAMVPGGHNANLFTATSAEQQQQNKVQASKINSTGRGALKQDIMCQEACGTCDTVSPEQFHPKDVDILETARAKLKKKTVSKDKKKVGLKNGSHTSPPGSPPRASPGTSLARATTTFGVNYNY